jgi:hypothetical protein
MTVYVGTLGAQCYLIKNSASRAFYADSGGGSLGQQAATMAAPYFLLF